MTAPVDPNTPTTTSADASAPPSGRGARIGWGLVLIAGGMLWSLHLLDVPIEWGMVAPVALIVVGLLVLVLGRRELADGLVGLGVVVALLALFGGAIGGPWSAAIGERVIAPTTVAELEDAASLGIGSLTVDLRGLDPAEVDGATLTGRLGIGELVVRAPDDLVLTGRARAAVGSTSGFGAEDDGVAPSVDDQGTAGGPEVLELDLQVGIGSIEVVQR
jgi:hypothetical protein